MLLLNDLVKLSIKQDARAQLQPALEEATSIELARAYVFMK